MTLSIIVGWRDKGDMWRKANLTKVLAHLASIDLAPVTVVDDGCTGPFNRSAAYNRGMELAPANVYIFHEADMLIPATQLKQAAEMAKRPGLVVPFDTYHYLTPEDTRLVRSGADPMSFTPQVVMTRGRSVGAVNVVSAQTMAAVGCWDESFTGWGYDDRAMVRAFEVATSCATRYVRSTVGVHLWHKPGWSDTSRFPGGARISDTEREATWANERRYRHYRQATTGQQIRELTRG